MKTIIALGLLTLSSSLSAIAHAEVKAECWDGSFAYQYAKIVETSRGVELSITGSNLGLPALYDNWAHSFSFGSWTSGSKPSLHVVLPNNPKTLDGATVWSDKTAIVEQDGWQQEKNPKIWVRHGVKNLGQWQWLYSDIEVSEVSVKSSDDSVSVSFRQRFAPGQPELQTLSIDCSHKSAPADLALPAEIANVLDAAAKNVKN